MDSDVIIYTQIGSLLAYVGTVFLLYRLLVKQKDATIGLLKERIDFIKDFTAKEDEDEENYVAPRHKALSFLNTLESIINNKNKKTNADFENLTKIFKIRSALRDPSSSAKTLLEALALNI